MVLSAVFATTAARAEQAAQDSNFVIQQAALSLLASGAAGGGGIYLANRGSGGVSGSLATALFLAGPLAAAATVCAIGSSNDRYEARGHCWPTIGVAMATVPAVFATALLFGGSASDGKLSSGQTATLAALWIALPPILATTGRHLFKRPKTPTVAAHPGRPVAFAGAGARADLPAKGQMMFQLTSAAF